MYQSPVLGFTSGVAFFVGMLSLFVSGAWLFFYCIKLITNDIGNISCNSAYSNICDKDTIRNAVAFVSWILEVALFKTTFSLQLLCTIALQMARFLERSQLKEARSQLSWLCSRDPTHLNSEELSGGTLESLSVRQNSKCSVNRVVAIRFFETEIYLTLPFYSILFYSIPY